MNDEIPEKNLTTGRLRAEDRRGRIGDPFIDPQKQKEELALQDPEVNWKEEPKDHRGRRIMLAFTIGTVLAAFGFVVFFLYLTPNPLVQDSARPAPSLSFIEKASATEIERAIEDCVRGFMNASNNKERCRFIIGGKNFLPQLDDYYYRPGINPPSSFARIFRSDNITFQGITMHTVVALETDENSAWIFNVLPTKDSMKIDWASSVCYGEKSWTHFRRGKPTSPTTMRVSIARAGRDTQSADPKKFAFCKIYTRGDDESLPGFFALHQPIAPALKKIIPPRARQPVRAKLRWNSEGTAVEVVKILHNFWIDLDEYRRFFSTSNDPN